MLDDRIKIIKIIWESEDAGGKTNLDFLSKESEIDKKELYKILKELEKEGYLEERKFLDKKTPVDFSLEQKGIDFIRSLYESGFLKKVKQ